MYTLPLVKSMTGVISLKILLSNCCTEYQGALYILMENSLKSYLSVSTIKEYTKKMFGILTRDADPEISRKVKHT